MVDTTLEAAIEAAYQYVPNSLAPSDRPEMARDGYIGDWVLSFTLDPGPWERWSCEDEDCPARPDWDRALAEATTALRDDLEREVDALIRQRLADFARQFQAEHPEAVIRGAEG